MKKFPVLVEWKVSKVVFIEANTEAGALDQAQNEQPTGGDPEKDTMEFHILTPHQ